MKIVLIFPVHLFKNNDLLSEINTKKYIIEHPVYFTKYDTHKLKLILHRASMKKYADTHNLTYIEYKDVNTFFQKNKSDIICYDPIDNDVLDSLHKSSKVNKFQVELYETPGFITSYDDLLEFHEKNKNKRFIHDSQFYRWRRESLKILVPIKKLSYE